jgi:hypothetical protein
MSIGNMYFTVESQLYFDLNEVGTMTSRYYFNVLNTNFPFT